MLAEVEACLYPAYESTAASSVISLPHCEPSNVLISLNARELPLLNRRQGTCRSRPTDRWNQAEAGEALALPIINGNQIGQPMDALEDDPGGPVVRKAEAASGCYASPNKDVREFEAVCCISLTAA